MNYVQFLISAFQVYTIVTTVKFSKGVPIESISKKLGYKNIKTTQHYAKIIDLKVNGDMKLYVKNKERVILHKTIEILGKNFLNTKERCS